MQEALLTLPKYCRLPCEDPPYFQLLLVDWLVSPRSLRSRFKTASWREGVITLEKLQREVHLHLQQLSPCSDREGREGEKVKKVGKVGKVGKVLSITSSNSSN